MTPEEYQWHVNLVKQRYGAYNLSYEQAEQVYRYEEDKSAHSEEHFFSAWEELDFELATFKEILQGEVLALFLSHHQARVQEMERQMREGDDGEWQMKNLKYASEISRYYKEVFIPSLWKNADARTFQRFMFMDEDKIIYLKAQYRKYLAARRKEILVSHYRHNKTLRPNELKQQLLHHSNAIVWPDYYKFYRKADVPTKSVGDFLYKHVTYRQERMNEFIKRSMEESKRFFNDLFKQYFGDARGWHVISSNLSEEEEIGNFRMNLLLLDPPENPFDDPLPEQ